MKNTSTPGKILSLIVQCRQWLIVMLLCLFVSTGWAQPVCSGNMIPNTTTPITIDANIEAAWNKAPVHTINNANIGALPTDFIGSQWRALYDATYLYILIEVKDANVRTPDSGDWWEDDAVEIYLDGNNSKGTTYDHINDFQYGFRYTDGTVHPGGNSITNTTGVNFSLQLVTGGYTTEVRIPWTTINGGAPFDGKQIGIDIAVNDDDNGGGRDGQIATYSSTDQAWVNPSLFGTNTLTVCIPAPLTILYTSTNPSCFGKTDATIRVQGEGGEPPYTYRLDKTGAFLANNGYFPGLSPRTGYIVEVKDATGAVVEGTTTIDIIEPVNTLVVNNDTTVCSGSPVNMSASGGQSYTWTFNTSSAVAGLSATNIANPVATPTATTIYTVTSQSSTNLIPNPGFEVGNVGFSSSYTYYNTPTIERKVYGIMTSPVNLDQYFTACGDHTTGTGKMMVVDGSAFITDTVWSQIVPVTPNTPYTFSYWIQTVAQQPQVARIETQINGAAVGTANAPASASCGNWQQVTYTWNSGANTTATICLYDRNNILIGNDFALDDFYFNSVCPMQKTVTITVDPAPAAPVATTVQPTCATPTGTITVTTPATGVTYSFDNGVTFQASATSNALSPNTYQVVVKNTTGCKSAATAITLNTVPSTPAAPAVTVTQPTCATATGTITVTTPATGVTYSFDNGITYQVSATSNALSPATYQVLVKNAAGCLSPATPATINTQPATPAAPVTTTTQPTCVNANGIITVTSPATGVTYSFDNGITFHIAPTSAVVAGNTYQVIVKNDIGGCTSTATPVIINAQPVTPNAPLVSTVQPTCATATGTITVTNPATGITYSFDNGTTFQAGATSGALVANTYQVIVKNSTGGCISVATAVTIDPQPAIPATPVATTTQPTCAIAAGTITVTTPSSGVTYSFDNGVTFQASAVSNALSPNTYQVVVKNNTGGCVSSATAVTINAQPVTPTAPVTTVIQPNCTKATGTITVSVPATGVTYSFDNGATFQASATSGTLPANTYQVIVKNTSGGCISPVTAVTINPQPTIPAAPFVGGAVSYCQGATAIPLSATGNNLTWYTGNSSAGSSTAPTPSTTSGGTTTYFVTASNGTCESPRSSIPVTVNAVSADAGVPEVRIVEGDFVLLFGTATGNNVNITWSPNAAINDVHAATPRVSPAQTQLYTMTVTAGNCVATDQVNVIVVKALSIPNVFSPNGDGINDKWMIKYIEGYPNATINIFNRYGQPVFESKGYSTPWDGSYKGHPLAVGAYYYIINPGDNSGILQGSISIVR